MITGSQLRDEFENALEQGHQCRFKYFTSTYPGAGSGYDDDVTLTQSGTDFWATGLITPIGGKDNHLLQQGLLKTDDKAFYIIATTPTEGLWRVGIGSPPANEYGLIGEIGVKTWSIANEDIYKKLYLRRLTTGSLAKE
jgi:hypothetical protein